MKKAVSWQKVTYGEIDSNARKVAASLYEKGVREGDRYHLLASLLTSRVLVLVPLSPETVYILIALGEHLGGN